MQVSVGSQCLDCVRASRPDVKTRAKFWNARQPTLITYLLIGINIAVYLWTLSANQRVGFGGGIRHGERTLGLDKPDMQAGEYYRLISSGFLHFGLFHIGMNMLLLFQLGQLLEPAVGRVRFGLLYFASLLGGSLGALMLEPNGLTGGASGAVFGLMAAAAIGMHRRGINIFRTGIGTVLVLNLVITFTVPGISVGGHLGGAIVGALCGFVMLAPRHAPLPLWATYATPVALVAVSIAASLAIAA
ncbi:MAG TPA: rhomboid family intramembrane serine protease [Ilumatobacteraceae bacterium]|nr:rhomboid family intramembrane serine protease [Ilumatobacteraceae bacterium]